MYYERKRHFHPILNLETAADSRGGYCIACNMGYRKDRGHRCTKKCPCCYAIPSCESLDAQLIRRFVKLNSNTKLKQEASGWPSECGDNDDDAKKRYLREYEKTEGIVLDRNNITRNPGLRSVAKLCLNSFWGKFGQRTNLPNTEIVKSYQQLMTLLTSPEHEITEILPVINEVIYVTTGHMAKVRNGKCIERRYLRFIQETRGQKDARSENKNAENNATRDASADNETMNDDVFHDLTQTSDIPSAHSVSNTGNITKNFDISSKHNHEKNNYTMKSLEEIVESVPKSYRKHAHLMMKHLIRNAVPDRINWDEHGIVPTDGNVVKDSNIIDLINDAMRERKTVKKAVGRNQFARLLRALNIPSALVRNKRLLSSHGVSVNSVKLRPRASSTPFISKAQVPRRLYREEREEHKNYEQETDEESSMILSRTRKTDTPTSLQTGKNRLLGWKKLR
ncbi:hypothetical protein ALC57_13346 [Trachymyrmex cornetzi]|uniref:DNA-directed DNA polymerase n=1 Tax=Trachymyrmex cornetzi TaxID=471704 RepID=A0A151IZE1_9HYME|nr:hypothetical protein ALC57_13346 [Trachymyrmex cornetzi]